MRDLLGDSRERSSQVKLIILGGEVALTEKCGL